METRPSDLWLLTSTPAGPLAVATGPAGGCAPPSALLPRDESLVERFDGRRDTGVLRRGDRCVAIGPVGLDVRVPVCPIPPQTFVLAGGTLAGWSGAFPPCPAWVQAAWTARGDVLAVEGIVLRIERLEGMGAMRVCRVEPLQPVPMPRFACLTPSQLEVCLMAGAGLALQEIADRTARSRETAKAHLRGAYARLEVSARVELGPVLEEWHRWTRVEPASQLALAG